MAGSEMESLKCEVKMREIVLVGSTVHILLYSVQMKSPFRTGKFVSANER